MDNQEKMTCPTVVQGNYSQGSDIFRLSSRGKQCMSMSFTFLVFCHAQNSCTVTKNDLDSVLVAGDNLYHEIVKEHSFLLANELPNYVKFERCCAKYILWKYGRREYVSFRDGSFFRTRT